MKAASKAIHEITSIVRKLTGPARFFGRKVERTSKSEDPFVRKMREAKAAKHRKKK